MNILHPFWLSSYLTAAVFSGRFSYTIQFPCLHPKDVSIATRFKSSSADKLQSVFICLIVVPQLANSRTANISAFFIPKLRKCD